MEAKNQLTLARERVSKLTKELEKKNEAAAKAEQAVYTLGQKGDQGPLEIPNYNHVSGFLP